MSYASIQEAWGVSSLSPRAAEGARTSLFLETGPKIITDARPNTRPATRPSTRPNARPNTQVDARPTKNLPPSTVRDFLYDTYRKHGLDSVMRLLPPRVVAAIRGPSPWAWLQDPANMVWLVIALFIVLVFVDLVGDRAPVPTAALPPW